MMSTATTISPALRAWQALLGALLGALLVPLVATYAWDSVVVPWTDAPSFADLGDALFTSALCGGIFGSAVLACFGGSKLPEWSFYVSTGAATGALILLVTCWTNASFYEGKYAARVQIGWFRYGTIPFLVAGALLGLSILRLRKVRER